MDASRRLWPRSDLRAGDADRQAVVSELQRHYVEGRLTSEELGERVSQALNSRTFGELATLLADLPQLSEGVAPHDLRDPADEPTPMPWHAHWSSPSFGLVLVLLGVVAMLLFLFAIPGGRFGMFPWPLLIWGFFIFGRPSGRRRF
jgi:uncharacterized protein DUF1707